MRKKLSNRFPLLLGGVGGGLVIVLCILQSCNVTRTVTTKSEYRQQGDTSVFIQTRTVESYDASKKGL